MCPIVCGVAFCDRADTISSGGVIRLGPLAHPLLLLPFVATVAKLANRSIALSWNGSETILGADGTSLSDNASKIHHTSIERAECAMTANTLDDPMAGGPVTDINDETWEYLNDLAYRTYAPASEASRLAGAGAGLTDIDL